MRSDSIGWMWYEVMWGTILIISHRRDPKTWHDQTREIWHCGLRQHMSRQDNVRRIVIHNRTNSTCFIVLKEASRATAVAHRWDSISWGISRDIMRQDMLMCRWPQLVAREYPAPHTHTYSCMIDTICLTIQWHAVHLFRLMHFVTSRTFLWIRRTSYCTVPPRPHSPSSAPCTPQRDSMTWCNDRWFNDMIQRHNQMAWFNQWQD